MVAHDVPHHHTISTFISLARAYALHGESCLIWTQDLQGAYRQFPVQRPQECFCALQTPQGVLLLRRHAIMFGAAAAVWNFNRAADALTFAARRILAVSIGHHVDDFIGVESSALYTRVFESSPHLQLRWA